MDKVRLLITSAGTSTATNIVCALANCKEFELFTADINPAGQLAAPHLGAVKHFQVPLASAREEYLTTIASIVETEAIQGIYPIHDLEIATLHESREQLPTGVKLPLRSSDTARNCSDKWRAYEICRTHDLPVPETWLAAAIDPVYIPTPIFLKPRWGVGSVGARLIRDRAELLNSGYPATEDFLMQEPCASPEITLDVVRTRQGRIYCIARERLETKAGVCTKARVFLDHQLTQLAEAVAEVFELDALFCMQVMRGAAGQWLVTDINPRCGGGTAMSAAAGLPVYQAFFSDWLQLPDAEVYLQAMDRGIAEFQETLVCRYFSNVISQRNGMQVT